MIDHVSRVQGYGEPVESDGRPFLRYRGTMIEISERGMQILDRQDLPLDDFAIVEITERMESKVEERVTELANSNVFGCGYAERANRPSIWLGGEVACFRFGTLCG